MVNDYRLMSQVNYHNQLSAAAMNHVLLIPTG